jgi:hypothetical protein
MMIWTNSGISFMLVILFIFGGLCGWFVNIIWRRYSSNSEDRIPVSQWKTRLQLSEKQYEHLQVVVKKKNTQIELLKEQIDGAK